MTSPSQGLTPTPCTSDLYAARLRRSLKSLPMLDRRVISWRFGLDGITLSRREIGKRLRLTTASVAVIEEAALETLRTELVTDVAA